MSSISSRSGRKRPLEITAVKSLTKLDPMTQIKALVLNSLTSPHSRTAYDIALTDFLQWCQAEQKQFTKATVNDWVAWLRDHQMLSASTINLRISAVRKLAIEAADNQFIDPFVAQAICRVKGIKKAGVRTGNWLTIDQAEKLLSAPRYGLQGRRDRAILAVLLGCGLRRSEVSNVTFEHIQQRDGRWVIVDLVGKGNRTRSVPMPSWAKATIDEWATHSNLSTGFVFRTLPYGKLADPPIQLSEQNIMNLVKKYGKEIGQPKLAPHDLRRTFAKLAHSGKARLEQIQLSLGHSSIQTTEKYLGVEQDLTDAPCDHIGLRIKPQ